MKQVPSWVTLDERALFGNILVTGSIGSGKTQGTFLCYLEQVLKNFSPSPAILAIDPKGTFAPKVIRILQSLGKRNRLLHLTLGGKVKINPVWVQGGLKNSKYVKIAQMLKAAGSNFIGRGSKDSVFWESQSETLIKHCLAYCIAKYEYFTLNELYLAVVEARDGELSEHLTKILSEKPFDLEERFNLTAALSYFKNEFQKMDEKLRSSILVTATTFLGQFQTYQAAKIFCPSKDEITITSFDEWIEDGRIFLFDVDEPGLSKSMGTYVKLLYEDAILRRLTQKRDLSLELRPVVLLVDEYQDVVSIGNGTLGDDEFLAKAREAKSITIAGSQSLISIVNRVGNKSAAEELFQLFRTRIVCNSTDLTTIKSFQELMGQEEKEKRSHSVSEYSQHTIRNLVLGGFESKDANISESVSTSEQKEFSVTAKELSRLKTFEAYAQVFDGVGTSFQRICLKPYFLEKKNTPHRKLLKRFANKAASIVVAAFMGFVTTQKAHASFPTVCTVVKTPEFNSCLEMKVSTCMCGWPIPRPCANFSYYIPKTYIEVFPDPKNSYFDGYPGAAAQLKALKTLPIPFGTESDDDTHSFHAHTITIPLVSIPFSSLPCGGAPVERTCFEGMSEHLGKLWATGSPDLLQPRFLAWSAAPKACLIKGAVTSATGEPNTSFGGADVSCSIPMEEMPKFPPSSHNACNGWGTFYPRTGIYNGGSQTVGALMIASRMKSLSSEVFQATPSSPDEKWQMIYPQSSSCFREGQNVGILETAKGLRELGRLGGKLKGHLFTVWHRVSCCKDLTNIPTAEAAIAGMKAVCQGAQ